MIRMKLSDLEKLTRQRYNRSGKIKRLKAFRETERAFQHRVIRLAQLHGWRVAHFRTAHILRANGSTYHATPVGANGKGFPDLVLVKDKTLMFVELKRRGEHLTPEQHAWRVDLLAAGMIAQVWRPEDWTEIEKTLAGG